MLPCLIGTVVAGPAAALRTGLARELRLPALLLAAALFSALVIALRLLWNFPGAYVSYFIRRRVFGQKFASLHLKPPICQSRIIKSGGARRRRS